MLKPLPRPLSSRRHRRLAPLLRFPELRWLDRFDILVPVLLAAALVVAGTVLARVAPALGTNGPQVLVWGFFISTVVLFHVTVTINSPAHRWGSRRFATNDDSRNNLLLALLTFGAGQPCPLRHPAPVQPAPGRGSARRLRARPSGLSGPFRSRADTRMMTIE